MPASFDEGARELTTQAAAEAGLGDVRLIEEPQAAFYDYLGAHAEDLDERLGDAKLILVVDVGGGTTDLTLVRVRAQRGDDGERLERIAVGGHLMLGGDNMDAALALFALEKAGIERPSDATVWSAIVQSARAAKERLLAADGPEEAVISYQGRGSRLLANTRSITVGRDEVASVLLDGFLPTTGPNEVAQKASRAGLTTLGLPFASDAAISRHVCSFLRRHADTAAEAGATVTDGLPRPDLVLLNGGVFNGHALIERLQSVLQGWYGDGDAGVRFLDHTSLDTAVARGAVVYGLSRRGVGESIGGGTARAYYIGVEGEGGRRQALCVAPKGMDDGSSVSVPDRVFNLRIDAPVAFPLYVYTGDRADAPGAMVQADAELDPLPALETVLRDRSRAAGEVPVTVSSTMTDTGALEIFLSTVELPPRKWKLEFVLGRESLSEARAREAAAQVDAAPVHDGFDQAAAAFAKALGSDDPKVARGLRRDVEKAIGPRGQWSAATCRALWDVCLEHEARRGVSDQHELSWLGLVGWSLRPGFGAPGDEDRIDALWALREEGLRRRSKATWPQWWILWRRVAAGLDATRQAEQFAELEPWLWREGKPPAGPHKHGPVEMMQLVSGLERISRDAKQRAGELFFERAKKIGSYWPLARVGARVLVRANPEDAVDGIVADAWLERLLALDWDSAEGAAFAAASLSRLTGDARRDVSVARRKVIADRLSAAKSPASWIEMVLRGGDMAAGDMKRVFGEGLPVGLRIS